jgi:hypothetical protein
MGQNHLTIIIKIIYSIVMENENTIKELTEDNVKLREVSKSYNIEE